MKRDLEHKILFGVCAGLGNELGMDATLVRLVFVILTLMGLGLPFIVYLILAIRMPAN